MRKQRMAGRVLFTAVVLVSMATPAVSRAGGVSVGGTCTGDANGDGQVGISELIAAVDNALSGCGLQPLVLHFAGKVGDQTFACGQRYEGIGTSASEIIPSDFRFYISNIRLLTADDREIPLSLDQDGLWQFEDVALLDFENKTPPCSMGTTDVNDTVRGKAPAGDYHGVRFTLGIPFRLGHQDTSTAKPPFDLSGMFWDWQGGYKFLRIDEATDLFRVHLGSTMCVSRAPTAPPTAPCGRPNMGEVILHDFDPASNVIVADMAALLADSDLANNTPDTSVGCQSDFNDPDCGPIFSNMGINFDNGLPDPSRQKFFRVE